MKNYIVVRARAKGFLNKALKPKNHSQSQAAYNLPTAFPNLLVFMCFSWKSWKVLMHLKWRSPWSANERELFYAFLFAVVIIVSLTNKQRIQCLSVGESKKFVLNFRES